MVRIHPDPPLFLRWRQLIDKPLSRKQIGLSVHDWGISSAGRAPALQAGGRRFDPVILHQSSMLVCLHALTGVGGVVKQALAIEPVRVI